MNKLMEDIDTLIKGFKNDSEDDGKFEDTHSRISLVLPNDYKSRYDEAQQAKNKKVSKLMVNVAKLVIDSVNPKAKP